MHSAEMTSTLTSSVKETENTTSSEIQIPSRYANKIRAWLNALFNGNPEKVLVVDTPQEQPIDITSAASVAPNKPVLLEQLYNFREPVRVNSFLNQYRFLVPLLLEASPKISKYFPGKGASLQVIIDPEVEQDEQLMVIIIETSSPDEVYDRLERFDNEWWIGAVGRAKGKLCVDVEFV
jgi:hypothetical protein